MNKTLITMALGALLASAAPPAVAGPQLPAEVAARFQAVEMPVYPGAVYCIGDMQVGVRFATRDDPATVRQWYREKLSDWKVFEEFGMWVLHDGKDDPSMGDIMAGNQVSVNVNAQIPGWHGLAANMTTEIMISLPRLGAATRLTIPGRNVDLGAYDIASIEVMDVEGPLERAGDVEGNRGDYYYIQTEDYWEYPVVFESQVDAQTWSTLQDLRRTGERFRVSGAVMTLGSGDVLGFDPTQPIEISLVSE